MPRSAKPHVTAPPPRLSGARLWIMRSAAMLLLPALTLAALEGALRLAGYGHTTRYWVKSEIDGTEYLVPNTTFTYLFFPPALARAPLTKRIPAEKPEGTYRIFLFGESAAYGDPEPSYGVGRQLEVLLRERYPGTDFEVVCTAMTAINSHAILPLARECAKLDGDLWVFYMGNNEIVGAFGAGTVFSSRAPPLRAVRATLAFKRTRTGQLLQDLAHRAGGQTEERDWAGIDMFSDHVLHPEDPARIATYRNFRRNFQDMLKTAERAGTPVIVSTVASNLRDCAPFASLLSENLGRNRRAAWHRHFDEGRTHEAAGEHAAALRSYEAAAEIDSGFAELQFRIGRTRLALDQPDAARAAFERARDADALAVRADSRVNRILRGEARRAGGTVALVDAERELARDAPHGLPGREAFYEHVHLTIDANYRLARLLADEVARGLPAHIATADTGSWVPAEHCERVLAMTLWDQHRLWNNMHRRLLVPPFTRQSSHAADLAYLRGQAQAVIARIGPDTPREDRELYERALAERPDDVLTWARFGQYLEAIGQRAEAIKAMERVCELLPDLEWPQFYAGNLLMRAERHAEAAERFSRALEIRRDFRQAREALDEIQSGRPATAGARTP